MFAAIAIGAIPAGCVSPPSPGSVGAVLASQPYAGSSFTTLGTFAGQVPSAVRAQPANLIRFGDQLMLVDVGDGASGQLAKTGTSLGAVQTVLLSHLHYDHTGGLFAFLGLRRVAMPGKLMIYGPPGTQKLVDGLNAALETGRIPGAASRGAPSLVDVVELVDGSETVIGGIRVLAAGNTHYSIAPESEDAKRHVSLSFRFELPDRVIVYTGDTGPSTNVERLAMGADDLIVEISDPDGLISAIRSSGRVLPPPVAQVFDHHMRQEHLVAEEVGRLASAAGVGRVVVTHIGIGDRTLEEMRTRIARAYAGPIVFANDLDRF